MHATPRVSVLIPVHNCRAWVARAVESALDQTYPATEVIVLDDGSTDGSGDILARYRPHIRLESCPQVGQNRARNRLTSWSSGEWLIYLDADDELSREAIETRLDFCFDADAIYGTMESAIFDGVTKVSSRIRVARDFPDPVVAAFEWRFPNPSAFMFRRAALIHAGWWNETAHVCTDYDLYFRLILTGARLKAAPHAMSLYRHWSASQAAHVNPLARVSTRLQLLNRTAKTLASSNRLTVPRRQAFEQSALKCIRALYAFDRDQARHELDKLKARNVEATPSPAEFARLYVLAFRFGGLDLAEAVAAWGRRLRRMTTAEPPSLPDFDAHYSSRRYRSSRWT